MIGCQGGGLVIGMGFGMGRGGMEGGPNHYFDRPISTSDKPGFRMKLKW